MPGGRILKNRVRELLNSVPFDRAVEELCRMPAQQVVNPLFSFLHHGNEKAKWAAVTAMGAVVSQLADQDMEGARVVLRRLMWSLNDESGGIGWGSPEAMGEILARHRGLAKEYAHILLSYTRPDGNYLEHEMLQRGLLWGIGRLAEARPDLLQDTVPQLKLYFRSEDPTVRALAARIMGFLDVQGARKDLERLTRDASEVSFWEDGRLYRGRVKDVAEVALKRLSSAH
ncbi:MAG: HEAT repeat domain-containing protein [Deltaproteobacteria bacterium]